MKHDMDDDGITFGKGDPCYILKVLEERLGRDGNVTDVKNVVPILELMEDTNLLADRCIFIDILRVTRNRTVLLKFVEDGGWDILYKWLQEARLETNKPFIIELLKLYKHLPITVVLLKQNSCAKDIRQLIKCNDTKIEALSKDIVDIWMTKVKENSAELSRKADKQKPGSSPSANATSPRSNSSSTHVGHGSSVAAKSRTDSSSATGVGGRTAHTSSAPSSDRRTAAHLNNGDSLLSSSSKETNNSYSDNVISVVCKDRPKTVKTIGSKMRSTGNCAARTVLRSLGVLFIS